jgi:hypothetical protein
MLQMQLDQFGWLSQDIVYFTKGSSITFRKYFLGFIFPLPAYKVRLKSIFAIFDQLSTHTISNVDDETILHQDSNNVDLVL